jgi:5-methylcytosine-specific restriction endonuclease McrA
MGFVLASAATFFLNASFEELLMSGISRSKVRHTILCKHCGTDFTVPEYRKDTAQYCSRSCMALAARSQITANCLECGNVFSHISSRANKAKYCGPECYHKAMHKKGSVQYNCVHCGIAFLDSPSTKRKYCSKACVNKAHKSEWKPDFTTVRKNMLARGMLTKCVRCGYAEHPEILGVHHKDRNRKNNDLGNLEVLCPNCHSLEHNRHTPHGFME